MPLRLVLSWARDRAKWTGGEEKRAKLQSGGSPADYYTKNRSERRSPAGVSKG